MDKWILFCVMGLVIIATLFTQGCESNLPKGTECGASGCEKSYNNCIELCNSNSMAYYKITSSGYAGNTYTCYCKNDKGAISTWPI